MVKKNTDKGTSEILYKTELYYFLMLNLVIIIISLSIYKILPPEIPLFYGLPIGSSQIASKWLLSIPPISSLVILGVNVGLSKIVREEFLKKTLILSAMFITMLSTITTLKIIFLIASI